MCLYVAYSRQFGRKVLVIGLGLSLRVRVRLSLVMNDVPYRTGAAPPRA